MKQLVVVLSYFLLNCGHSTDPVLKRYEAQAARVTIIRDSWGVPHIYGKTDADAVFGLMYTQCEESFERVERNYLRKFGRMAEVEGAGYLIQDLQMRLLYDTVLAKADYDTSPAWLRELCNAFADGINYYLHKHPEKKPAILKRFEPWFPMMLTDGAYIATQMGGLEMEDTRELYKLRDSEPAASITKDLLSQQEKTGSNGFAIGASKSANKNALLYINPHVTFDFRTEAHMISEEGLNAYGAVTWGQFFVFQGFNLHCGWMHTSSMADAADLYRERIKEQGNKLFYEYNGGLKPVGTKQLVLQAKDGPGMKTHTITTYYTHHGPVMGSRKGGWLSLKARNQSMTGLVQSWQRIKAGNYGDFKRSMQFLGNTSTNTLYADDKGNIAYWHGNFIPKRNLDYDCSMPMDGSTPATEWRGVHELQEIVQFYNPASGWIQNCNSNPFSAAGLNALNRNGFPGYMGPEGENFRSVYVLKAFDTSSKFTLESLITFGNTRHLSAFDSMLPPLLLDIAALSTDSANARLKEAGGLLNAWDRVSSVSSVPTTLAVLWAYTLLSDNYAAMEGNDQVQSFTSAVRNTPSAKRTAALRQVIAGLDRNYGSWKIAWGDLNRYQRINGDIAPGFDDNKKSLPAGAASALFGSLPAYETDWANTRKGYGVAGNSFVAAVEFGPRIRARSVVPGGQSFNPTSRHFKDQAQLYLDGQLKEVYFYKEDVLIHQEKKYRPGEE